MANAIGAVMAVAVAVAMLPAPTSATAAIDLAEILAGPPSPDYSEITTGGPAITGPFDSRDYAQWLASTGADVSGIEAAYDQHGFTRGYGRSWLSISATRASPGISRRNYLVETVEEYSSDAGARWRFQGLRASARNGGEDFVREIKTPIANSFGAVAFSGWEYCVVFAKGNDTYIVRFDSDVDDMTTLVVQQAQAQEEIAPAYTIPPSQWSSSISPGGINIPAKLVIALGFYAVVGVIGLIGAAWRLIRRRSG